MSIMAILTGMSTASEKVSAAPEAGGGTDKGFKNIIKGFLKEEQTETGGEQSQHKGQGTITEEEQSVEGKRPRIIERVDAKTSGHTKDTSPAEEGEETAPSSGMPPRELMGDETSTEETCVVVQTDGCETTDEDGELMEAARDGKQSVDSGQAEGGVEPGRISAPMVRAEEVELAGEAHPVAAGQPPVRDAQVDNPMPKEQVRTEPQVNPVEAKEAPPSASVPAGTGKTVFADSVVEQPLHHTQTADTPSQEKVTSQPAVQEQGAQPTRQTPEESGVEPSETTVAQKSAPEAREQPVAPHVVDKPVSGESGKNDVAVDTQTKAPQSEGAGVAAQPTGQQAKPSGVAAPVEEPSASGMQPGTAEQVEKQTPVTESVIRETAGMQQDSSASVTRKEAPEDLSTGPALKEQPVVTGKSGAIDSPRAGRAPTVKVVEVSAGEPQVKQQPVVHMGASVKPVVAESGGTPLMVAQAEQPVPFVAPEINQDRARGASSELVEEEVESLESEKGVDPESAILSVDKQAILTRTGNDDRGMEDAYNQDKRSLETEIAAESAGTPIRAEGINRSFGSILSQQAAPPDVTTRVVQIQDLMARFDDHVLSMTGAPGDRTMNIILEPRSLGKITLRCREEGAEMAVELVAGRAGVSALLRQQESALRDVLQQNGYQLTQFDVRSEGDRQDDRPSSWADDVGDEASPLDSIFGEDPDEDVLETLQPARGRRDGIWVVA